MSSFLLRAASRPLLLAGAIFAGSWLPALPTISQTLSTPPVAPSTQNDDGVTANTVGAFSTKDAEAAQVYIDQAMTVPMEKTIVKAGKFDPQAMLVYGLGLEIGRAPVTDVLNQKTRDMLQAAYRDIIRIYLPDSHLKLGDNRDEALNDYKFWLPLAQRLGPPQAQTSFANSDVIGGTDALQSNNIQATGSVEYNSAEYHFSDTPMLPRGVALAAQACITDAVTLDDTRRLQALEGAQVPKMTPAQLDAIHAKAKLIYVDAALSGPSDCGGSRYFDKVTAYTAQFPRRFATLKYDSAIKSAR